MADAVKSVYDLLSSEKKKESASIYPKEFFWDQFLKYIASAILALTVLNVSIEFLRGGGVSCFPPSDNVAITAADLEGRMMHDFGTGQTSYINNYCARSVPQTEYFPIYILIHGLLLIVPHYVWNAIHNGDFDSFFSIVEKLDRLRDSKTGEYHSKNFDRVTKLEQEYSSRKIYFTYILKLALQLLICIGSVVFSISYFQSFSFIFFCPGDSVDDVPCPVEYAKIGTPCGWPLNTTVPCVYTSLRILSLIRYADFILLTVAAGLVLFGLAWCLVRHTEQLGHEAIARFSFHSCLNSDIHKFPSLVFWSMYKCFRNMKLTERKQKLVKYLWIFTHRPQLRIANLFSPRIQNDYDFLLLMLFRADTSHGQVFKDIQISKDLKGFIRRDHQLLHLYVNVQNDLEHGAYKVAREARSSVEPNEESEPELDEKSSQTTGDVRATAENSTDFHMIFLTEEKSDIETSTNPEERLFTHFKKYLGNLDYNTELFSGMRDWIYYFARTFGPKRDCGTLLRNGKAIDISFGSVGFGRVLARPFKLAVSLDFHPFYYDLEQVADVKRFYTNHKSVRFPYDIFAHDTEKINRVGEAFKTVIRKKCSVDFIVVGPLVDESKKVVVNLLINLLFTANYIGKKAALLAVRPLKVGTRNLTKQFHCYEPPEGLFRLRRSVLKRLNKHPTRKNRTRIVDDIQGVEVVFGQIPCVFEFTLYEFIITPKDDTTDQSQTSSKRADNSQR